MKHYVGVLMRQNIYSALESFEQYFVSKFSEFRWHYVFNFKVSDQKKKLIPVG